MHSKFSGKTENLSNIAYKTTNSRPYQENSQYLAVQSKSELVTETMWPKHRLMH